MSQPDERTHGSGQERPPVTAMYRNRHRLGTTLVEVLVVIVVFLVGILAVIQIFPKGYQILLLTRGKSVSQALARDTMECGHWKCPPVPSLRRTSRADCFRSL